jgi:hypothetical protein
VGLSAEIFTGPGGGVVIDLKELQKPFFARNPTKRFIDELGHLDPLCVFIGSGVTVDRTGLDWNTLFVELLVKLKEKEETARLIVTNLKPRAAGSAIVHRYYNHYGADEWKLRLVNDVRDLLYDIPSWLGGRSPQAMAELWTESFTAGQIVSLVTTNYDTHIEAEIALAAKVWVSQLSESDDPEDIALLASLTAHIQAPVRHLHGTVHENAESELPVISERDYLNASSDVGEALYEEFTTKHVLIVGSGLDDPPLLNALLRTKSGAEMAGLKRYAIVPRSDFGAQSDETTSVTLIRLHEDRLRHLGVEGIHIDHYSQIAQIFDEARVASTLDKGEYPGSHKRHGERLYRWWQQWHAPIASDHAGVQERHHRRLVEGLAEIRQELEAPDEPLRFELWVRWSPSNDREGRRLRLWASSLANFADSQLTRSVPIAPGSNFACMKAFSEGRVVYDEGIQPTERWQSFMAAPLKPLQHTVSLVVGSVVISSMRPLPDSCLGKENRRQHRNAIGVARRVGAELTAV